MPLLFSFVPVGSSCADVCLFLGGTRAVRSGGVAFLTGLCLDLPARRCCGRAQFLEDDAVRYGLCDFFFIGFSHDDERGFCQRAGLLSEGLSCSRKRRHAFIVVFRRAGGKDVINGGTAGCR